MEAIDNQRDMPNVIENNTFNGVVVFFFFHAAVGLLELSRCIICTFVIYKMSRHMMLYNVSGAGKALHRVCQGKSVYDLFIPR